MHDGESCSLLEPSDDVSPELARLRPLPIYKAIEDAHTQLDNLAQSTHSSKAISDMAVVVRRMQTRALHHVTTSSLCSRYSLGVLALDALRSLVLVHGLGGGTTLGEKARFWQNNRDLVLSEEAVATIKLTDWQIRALLRPTPDCEHLLTHWQDRVFRLKFSPSITVEPAMGAHAETADIPDLERLKPVPISWRKCHDSRLDSKTKDLVCKLFCKIWLPQNGPVMTPRTLTPIPTAGGPAPARRSSFDTAVSASSPGSTYGRGPPTVAVGEKDLPAQPHPYEAIPSPASTLGRSNPIPYGPSNAFGQPRLPSKRPSASEDLRHAKSPRLGFRGDIEDLRQHINEGLRRHADDLSTYRAELTALQDEQRTEAEAGREQLRGVSSGLGKLREAVEGMRSAAEHSDGKMQEMLGALETRFDTESKGIATEMRSNLERSRASADETIRALETGLNTKVASIATEMRSALEKSQEATEERLRALATGLEAKIDGVALGIDELKSLLAKAPRRLGEECCLVDVCPAPEGQQQNAYESRLFQAALSYIYILWDPFCDYENGGVCQDATALDETKKKFPGLEEPAIVEAIEYIHRQIFNRPLGRPDAAPSQIYDGVGSNKFAG